MHDNQEVQRRKLLNSNPGRLRDRDIFKKKHTSKKEARRGKNTVRHEPV